ncbi:MAG TPA: YgiQ family radical SAM protein, partial [Ruminococcaceae bacterium]|nr:YgiQ family radical SAM protein [Oscillospiraceae bacterium]
STIRDAIELAVFLKKEGLRPEQVQDFYPTPGTISTCMFYTGLDPYTLKPVYVPRTPEEKAKQRALLQYFKPENREMVLAALKSAGR